MVLLFAENLLEIVGFYMLSIPFGMIWFIEGITIIFVLSIFSQKLAEKMIVRILVPWIPIVIFVLPDIQNHSYDSLYVNWSLALLPLLLIGSSLGGYIGGKSFTMKLFKKNKKQINNTENSETSPPEES